MLKEYDKEEIDSFYNLFILIQVVLERLIYDNIRFIIMDSFYNIFASKVAHVSVTVSVVCSFYV